MNKYLLLFVSLIMCSLTFAQPPNKESKKEKEERIRRDKIAFISTELNLSPEEAQVFWPIYNEYEAELDLVRKEKRKYHKELKNMDELSDDRAYELTELMFETDQKENEIRLKYLGKFAEVLGKKKAARVFMAEEMFKRELLKNIKKNGPPPGGQRGPKRNH